MKLDISQKSIKDTVKMFKSLQESGEVFTCSHNDHKAVLTYRHCADHRGDISILTLNLCNSKECKEYNFLPSAANEVIEHLYNWYK